MIQFGRKLDTRDGRWYRTVLMPDGNWWTAENLAYTGGTWQASDSQIPGAVNAYSAPFGNPANIASLGAFYWQDDDYFVVPGCHKPSGNEIVGLINACGGNFAAGLHLKSTEMWTTPGDDLYGFNILPTNIGGNEYFSQFTRLSTNVPGIHYSHYTFGQFDDVYESWGTYRLNPYRLIVDSGNIPDPIPKVLKITGAFDNSTITSTAVNRLGETVPSFVVNNGDGTVSVFLDGNPDGDYRICIMQNNKVTPWIDFRLETT